MAWFARSFNSRVRKNEKFFIKIKRTNLKSDGNNFREAAAVARKICKEAYNNIVFKAFSGSSLTNPRRFFSYVKTKRCGNIGVVPLRENETIVISNAGKARVLNNQLCGVFTKKDLRIPKLTSLLSPEMPEINIDIESVKQLIKNLDPLKATSTDKLECQFLKLMTEELSAGMSLIFRASLQQVGIRNAWLDALISPLYKSGKTVSSNPKNYRPVNAVQKIIDQ